MYRKFRYFLKRQNQPKYCKGLQKSRFWQIAARGRKVPKNNEKWNPKIYPKPIHFGSNKDAKLHIEFSLVKGNGQGNTKGKLKGNWKEKLKNGVEKRKELQKSRMFEHIKSKYGTKLEGKRFAIWSFVLYDRLR